MTHSLLLRWSNYCNCIQSGYLRLRNGVHHLYFGRLYGEFYYCCDLINVIEANFTVSPRLVF